MSLLFRTSNVEGPYWGEFPGASAADVIPYRYPMQLMPGHMINSESALRYSAVWACLRLRADLISSFPVQVFRTTAANLPNVLVTTPPILKHPGGVRRESGLRINEWIYNTQFDLDRAGNTVGVITELNGYGLPARIELVPLPWVSIKVVDNRLEKYFIRGMPFEPEQIWHERQYTVSGYHLGLSPVMYAAWCISENLSIQDFAISWFTTGGIPRAHMKNNTQATITNEQTDTIKARVKESVHSGDVLVTGRDWEYNLISPEQTGMEWIEARRLGPTDIARFFNVPADLIDAAVSGDSITYANIIQRNLQFLTMSLGPMINRREMALNDLLPEPQYMRFNIEELQRMDPSARAEMGVMLINARVMTPDEVRLEYYDRPPLSDEQYAQFARLWPARAVPGTGGPPSGPAPGAPKDRARTNGHQHPDEYLEHLVKTAIR